MFIDHFKKKIKYLLKNQVNGKLLFENEFSEINLKNELFELIYI
jgi:hypothetical protein